MIIPVLALEAAALLAALGPAVAETVTVHDMEGLREAVSRAKPGTRILLEPGEYPGGLFFAGLRGEEGRPIAIAARDPKSPPVFKGGANGLHLSDPSWVEIEDLVVSGSTANGINIDDGGSLETPARHIALRRLKVKDIGPGGNRDGLKLSGVDDFKVEGCLIERWGTGGGSGIDMVGCHRGLIEGCVFRHTDRTGSSGVQAKGGSREIVIRRNRFEDAGGRGINIGGSTGLKFFRPPLESGSGKEARHFEAKDIRVEGNTFIGGGAPVAFVGVDGAAVRFNTIYRPRRWALRILQETTSPGFVPSRCGEFTDNIIAFRSDELSQAVNIGPGTAPETFKFARNFWYSIDRPQRSRPDLPGAEEGGIYGQDPLFEDAEGGDHRLKPASPARGRGAEALSPDPPRRAEKG